MEKEFDRLKIETALDTVYQIIQSCDKGLKEEEEYLRELKSKFPLPEIPEYDEDNENNSTERDVAKENLEIFLQVAERRDAGKKTRSDLIAKKIECVKLHTNLIKLTEKHNPTEQGGTDTLDDDAKSNLHENLLAQLEKQKNG